MSNAEIAAQLVLGELVLDQRVGAEADDHQGDGSTCGDDRQGTLALGLLLVASNLFDDCTAILALA